MALLPTVTMLKLFKILHLEPTDACNAACPQCAREIDMSFDKSKSHHLTVEQIQSLVSTNIIKNLDKMFMCGDYGDPAAGKHTLDIYRYFRSINSEIVLGMNTNGGIKSTEWWVELANIMSNTNDYVVFSIDGLQDTNHIYRVNVNWNKVIENAQAFISAGGSAHWDMLVFEHNQHQVDQCEQLSRTLGFKWFRAKVSKRHDIAPIEFLNMPIGWKDPVVKKGEIKCEALATSSRYISADGRIFPCCYLGTTTNTIEKFDQIQTSWQSNSPEKTCSDVCQTNEYGSSFTNQWQREVKLK